MLKIEGLFKQFGGFVAIDDVSFELLEGEKHAIIGPNGAGKTTFFNLVTGHLLPDRGSVAFQGEDITGRRRTASSSSASRAPSSGSTSIRACRCSRMSRSR